MQTIYLDQERGDAKHSSKALILYSILHYLLNREIPKKTDVRLSHKQIAFFFFFLKENSKETMINQANFRINTSIGIQVAQKISNLSKITDTRMNTFQNRKYI